MGDYEKQHYKVEKYWASAAVSEIVWYRQIDTHTQTDTLVYLYQDKFILNAMKISFCGLRVRILSDGSSLLAPSIIVLSSSWLDPSLYHLN